MFRYARRRGIVKVIRDYIHEETRIVLEDGKGSRAAPEDPGHLKRAAVHLVRQPLYLRVKWTSRLVRLTRGDKDRNS